MIKNFLIKNGTHILTGVGVVGVFATAFLSGKGAIKAHEILAEHCTEIHADDENEQPYIVYNDIPLKEKIKLTWKCFIPAALVGTATIAAFVSGHAIDRTQLKEVTAAYILSKDAFRRYREEVAKDSSVVEQEIYQKSKEKRKDDETFNPNKIMQFKEPVTGQFFSATPQDIIFAEAKINRMFQNNMCCSYAQFLKLLGLKIPNDIRANKIGWWLDDSYSYNSSFFGNWIGIDFYKPLGASYCELTFTHDPMEPDEPNEWKDYANWERA